MNTISRGNAAEAAVLHALIKAELVVLMPFGGGASFDLAVVLPPDGEIARIQVKSGRVRLAADYEFERWVRALFDGFD